MCVKQMGMDGGLWKILQHNRIWIVVRPLDFDVCHLPKVGEDITRKVETGCHLINKCSRTTNTAGDLLTWVETVI